MKQLSNLVEKHKVNNLMRHEMDIKGRQCVEKSQMKTLSQFYLLVKRSQNVRAGALVRNDHQNHVNVREDMSQTTTSIWV